MCWGPMVREMIRHNTFYSVPEAALHTHKDYPPFFALLGSLFCHFGDISYSESRMYIGQMAFQFSLFMPAFSLAENSKKGRIITIIGMVAVILAGFTVQVLPFSSNNIHYYNCVSSDWALGLFASYTFFVILKEKDERFRYLNTALCLWVLISMKQMGIAFCLLGMLLFFIKEVFIEKKKDCKALLSVLAVFAVPVICYLIWQKYVASTGALDLAQFRLNQIKLGDFIAITKGTDGEAWQHEAFVNFMNAIVNRKLLVHPVSINYIWSSVIITVIILTIDFVDHDEGMKYASAVFLFGSVCYAFAMLLLYIFSFGSIEGPGLASFNRYMFTYLFFGICFLLMSGIFDSFRYDRHAYSRIIVCLALVALFSDYSTVSDLKPRKYGDSTYQSESYRNIIETIRGDKVLVVEQYSSDDDYLYIMLDYDNVFENGSRLIRIGNRGWYTPQTIEITTEEWTDMLKDYDHLFVAYADDYFLDNYFYKVTDEPFLNRGYYQIHVNDDEIALEFVCTFD